VHAEFGRVKKVASLALGQDPNASRAKLHLPAAAFSSYIESLPGLLCEDIVDAWELHRFGRRGLRRAALDLAQSWCVTWASFACPGVTFQTLLLPLELHQHYLGMLPGICGVRGSAPARLARVAWETSC
jgi:hypothetical protein